MKKSLTWMGALLVLLFLVACGNDDDVENAPTNDANNATEEDTATDGGTTDSQTADNSYPFTHFELDVDMEEELDVIEVEYEYEADEIEASYRDKNRGIDLTGDEAMEELDELFTNFAFDETSSKDEVLDAVRSTFSIPEDTKRIEVDITYPNGTDIEFVEE